MRAVNMTLFSPFITLFLTILLSLFLRLAQLFASQGLLLDTQTHYVGKSEVWS